MRNGSLVSSWRQRLANFEDEIAHPALFEEAYRRLKREELAELAHIDP